MRTVKQRFADPLTDALRPHHILTSYLTVFLLLFTSHLVSFYEKEFTGVDIHKFPNTFSVYVSGRGQVGRGCPEDIDLDDKSLWVRL